jgi:hypothetical protein
MAPTGAAAYIIGGRTLHNALRIDIPRRGPDGQMLQGRRHPGLFGDPPPIRWG